MRPRTIRLLTLAGIGLSLAMLGLGAYTQWDARQDAWRQAERSSENVLAALEHDIARNLTTIDLSMQGAIDALADPEIDRAPSTIRHQALFDRSASAEHLGSVLVTDETGEVREDSTALVPHSLNLSHRDYFIIHQNKADVGLYLSRPFRSQLRNGDLSISLSRRLPSPDGSFKGVVASALGLSYFHQLFERLSLGREGSVTLIRSDGQLLARFPSIDGNAGHDLSQSPVFQVMRDAASGSYVGSGQFDGVERLFTFRHIRGLPLILTVNMSVKEIFAAWKTKTLFIGGILVFLAGATMGLCLLFQRELLRRERAERALETAARDLATMATRDGLTGLVNRRGFEQSFHEEWDRAVTRRSSIGLLMLDTDCFKLFNDRYGHPEGDRVLRAIADCLTEQTREDTDLCARYGGEEFVVILSRPDARGAAITAERIRHAVEALRIEHADSSSGLMTVSVGMAVLTPKPGDKPAELLKAADDALYRAKRNGRNRVQIAGASVLVEQT